MTQPAHLQQRLPHASAAHAHTDMALWMRRPAPDLLEVTRHQRRPDLLIVTVDGELDAATAPLLHQHLATTLLQHTVLNLTDVPFCAVAGLRVIEAAAAHARLKHRHLGLVVSDAQVLRIFRQFQVESRIPVHPTLAAAVAAMPGAQETAPPSRAG